MNYELKQEKGEYNSWDIPEVIKLLRGDLLIKHRERLLRRSLCSI